ncbi:MAG: peptide ABC transporter substrate-binding protein, partial [Clostridiales bacterium]|nr:peptide ABC transporter substrate-binding protein [Clostridiales bacterium]
YALINNDIIDDWKVSYPEYLSKSRLVGDYSYFYTFNFDPTYDEALEPENWRKAVNNTNFRLSLTSAFDRLYALYATEPDDPQSIMQTSITPRGFVQVEGEDFADMPAFEGVEEVLYDKTDEQGSKDKALAYKDKAIEELSVQGVSFPVKVVLSYRIDMKNWERECILVKQQLEGLLGTDYIQVELNGAAQQDFLANVRKGGKYSMMRVNWGADYLDPETFTDPFEAKMNADVYTGNSYNKMDVSLNGEGYPETKEIVQSYYDMVEKGKEETLDVKARYELFAQAEAILIEKGIVIPFYITPPEYQASKLNPFEGQFAPFGISTLRMKGKHVQDHFVTPEEYEQYKADWEAGKSSNK